MVSSPRHPSASTTDATEHPVLRSWVPRAPSRARRQWHQPRTCQQGASPTTEQQPGTSRLLRCCVPALEEVLHLLLLYLAQDRSSPSARTSPEQGEVLQQPEQGGSCPKPLIPIETELEGPQGHWAHPQPWLIPSRSHGTAWHQFIVTGNALPEEKPNLAASFHPEMAAVKGRAWGWCPPSSLCCLIEHQRRAVPTAAWPLSLVMPFEHCCSQVPSRFSTIKHKLCSQQTRSGVAIIDRGQRSKGRFGRGWELAPSSTPIVRHRTTTSRRGAAKTRHGAQEPHQGGDHGERHQNNP